jgi:hypothetical protein
MRAKIPVFAVIRIDGLPDSLEAAHNLVTITKVLPRWEDAVKEAERLNKINGGKGARYFCQTTRYYPDFETKDV